MESQLHLVGRLVNDPTQRVAASGLKITRFRMASSGRRFDKNGGDWVDTDPVYMSVVCWRQLGDNIMQTLRKGDSVVVIGRLIYREWDEPDGGGRRSLYEIDANAVGPDLNRYVTQLSRPLRELPDVAPDAVPTQAEPVVEEQVATGAAAA